MPKMDRGVSLQLVYRVLVGQTCAGGCHSKQVLHSLRVVGNVPSKQEIAVTICPLYQLLVTTNCQSPMSD